MNHLLRSLAPISDRAWELLDGEARARLTPALAGRRVVDFGGPRGWEHSATNLGRTSMLDASPVEGVAARQRRVLPLVELRADFTLSRDELRDADRGADDLDLSALDEAALQIARAENAAVVHGVAGALVGIADVSPNEHGTLTARPETYVHEVAEGLERLLLNGIGGPYGLVLDSERFRRVVESSESGTTLLRHLKELLDGPVLWAPGVTGGLLVSLRGGDFVLDCGQDLSIGYDSHDADVVRLYLEESFSFHAATPEAAVAFDAE